MGPFTRNKGAVIVCSIILLTLLYRFEYDGSLISRSARDVELVVASLKSDNTTWLQEYFPLLRKSVYVTDDPNARHSVPTNKGRESAVYLTHIIDNYDRLAETTIFIHSHRYQWHNEDPYYDGVPVLKNFKTQFVKKHGFATLRCSWEPGCPAELEPDPNLSFASLEQDDSVDDRHKTQAAFHPAFKELFPDLPVPKAVGIHCGAQFAVSRNTVRARPRSDYVRYRDWLYSSSLPDYISGRILEYSWHIIFGQESVACPHAGWCFCEKFGLCNLDCVEHSCAKRYKFVFGVIPEGWPEVGPGTNNWPEKNWAE